MKTNTVYTCEFCEREFKNADACINHEKECNYRLRFYDRWLNLISSLEPNSLNGVSYIRVPSYKEYVKLISIYPDTAVLRTCLALADFPIIICRTTFRRDEWMLFSDYCKEVTKTIN